LNRKAEFVKRRVEQIRRDQGDRNAEAYLAEVARNDAADQRRAEVEHLSSGVTPEGYGGYVPAHLRDWWEAQRRDTSLGQGQEADP